MNGFPPEILDNIARRLPQKDLLHFAFSCRKVYLAVHQELYLAIIIDSAKRVYTEEYNDDNTAWFLHTRDFVCEPVVIRSLFALKRFFRTLVAHPEYVRHIRFLVAKDKIPDIPDFDLHEFLRLVFPNLVNLQVLNWYLVHCPLDAQLIQLLPFPQRLHSLCGNFNQINSRFSKLDLRCLRYLDLSHLETADIGRSFHLPNCRHIESLTLSKPASQNKLRFTSHLTGCCKDAIGSKLDNLLALLNAARHIYSLINPFLLAARPPLNLKSLVLRGICVKLHDAHLILRSINVRFLKHLTLENCFEDLFQSGPTLPNQVQIIRRTPPQDTFLSVLSTELVMLELLNLGLFNELCHNEPTFAFISGLRGLSKISVHIKNFCRNSAVDLTPLIDSLQPHKDLLQHLSICHDVVERLSSIKCLTKVNKYELKSIVGLANLWNLKLLRLPLCYSQISDLARTILSLKQIQIIQLLITDLASNISSTSCGGCYGLNYVVCGNSSLIAQGFFDCANTIAETLKEEKKQHYLEFVIAYRNVFRALSYLRIDMQSESMVFDCHNAQNIELKDQTFVNQFNTLKLLHLP